MHDIPPPGIEQTSSWRASNPNGERIEDKGPTEYEDRLPMYSIDARPCDAWSRSERQVKGTRLLIGGMSDITRNGLIIVRVI
jgi:hypothetical protein